MSRQTRRVGTSCRFSMRRENRVALNLAAALLSGTWSVSAMARRATEAWGYKQAWFRKLARRVIAAFGAEPARPGANALAQFIDGDEDFRRHFDPSCVRRLFWVPD